MATFENLVNALMLECGKDSSEVKERISQQLADVTVELLSQNLGKFEKLKKRENISVTPASKKYLLPEDFNSASDVFWEVDDNGDFSNEIFVVTKQDYASRVTAGITANAKMAYIEFDIVGDSGRGDYLVLGDEPTASSTYQFQYFRYPNGNDTDIITDITLLKRGVRGGLPDLFPLLAEVDLNIYISRLGRFGEKGRGRIRQIIVKPAVNVRNRNINMHKYGGGS